MSNRARRQAINQMNVNAPAELTSIIAPMSSIGADTQAAQTANQRLATTSRPPLVTALPSGALDGQEVLYLTSNSGPIWHLRNRLTNPDGTANASPYKWDMVGGMPLAHEGVGGQNYYTRIATSSTSAAALGGSAGPAIIAPLSGEYHCWGNANAYLQNTSGAAALFLWQTGWGAPAWNGADSLLAAGTGHTGFLAVESTWAVAAGSSIELRYATSNASFPVEWWHRSLRVRPLRVA